MNKYAGNDHYLDNGVFKNKLGIQNQTILQEREADYATVRAYELAKHPLRGVSTLTTFKPFTGIYSGMFTLGRVNSAILI